MPSAEQLRLIEARAGAAPWRRWGPYLSERQWGTVREDLSPNGDAWNYVSHDAARAWAYAGGEDGLAGVSDDKALMCLALALWNGHDPILKERPFGLTNGQGNHGEDVKEYYFYLDSTPTHSYMKYLYKYPQRAYPYDELIGKNASRSRLEPEYELLDTGIFDDDRYFDVFVEVAKAQPEDLLVEITVHNRGPDPAPLHLLPTVWFRNTWAAGGPRPTLALGQPMDRAAVIAGEHPILNARYLYAAPDSELLFTGNETNSFRFPHTRSEQVRYFKDAFHWYVVHHNHLAVDPARAGTKAAVYQALSVPAHGSASVRVRLCDVAPAAIGEDPLGENFTRVLKVRRDEADEFYAEAIPAAIPPEQRRVMRQAFAGMFWGKQYYDYDVTVWLRHHGVDPYNNANPGGIRNIDWHHMVNGDVISMPDKWEYPWYAAWDLAFHTVALGAADPDLAKSQLLLLLQERYLHPNGQVPAYEWNFSDVNPPVHAWAAFFIYQVDRLRTGTPDRAFLEKVFDKLLLNFTWWVNRKDPRGRNMFEGGFLGLDNIGVFDRSAPLPTGGYLEQADGTAWMAFYCQMMLQMALELSLTNPNYSDMALKFFEHFIWIASAMTYVGGAARMWDPEDGFFYDVLRTPDGGATTLKVQSIVGLLPLAVSTIFHPQARPKIPDLVARAQWFIEHRAQLVGNIHDPRKLGLHGRVMLAILGGDRLRRVLEHMLSEEEFLSPFGIRSLSARHRDQPYRFWASGQEYQVRYLPGESDSGMFGGNSNWRGPIWFPMNALLIQSLLSYYAYYGDEFQVDFPTGSGRKMNLYQVAEELTQRLARIFTPDAHDRRPVYGGTRKFQEDPHWRDHVLFYEYFHGDNGAGIGASHQTGWTGLIAALLTWFSLNSAERVLETGGLEPTETAPIQPWSAPLARVSSR
jgi:hypothetical protein